MGVHFFDLAADLFGPLEPVCTATTGKALRGPRQDLFARRGCRCDATVARITGNCKTHPVEGSRGPAGSFRRTTYAACHWEPVQAPGLPSS